ncbi:MAG: 6-carboxytetrahydropterin synthase QueD [Anaerovoracaceae bacterium]|jgi:6-pyruvoyltetrahydropterin/6-carboxytetrahydropterin synthase
MLLIKEFEFDAAHNLVHYHGKCERLHGHTYKLVVKLRGSRDSEDMIYDFSRLKRLVEEEILSRFDHQYLNDFLPQPTAENIAVYIWDKLEPLVRTDNAALHEIEVWETKTSGVVYRGPGEEEKTDREGKDDNAGCTESEG